MTAPGRDRRSRRREETIAEILDLALELIAEQGAAALSMSEVARRLGVRPPSLYKYFPSRMAIYDALFERGQRQHLAAVRSGIGRASPGLAAVEAGLDASGRWGMANQALNQLLFWRPVPGFEPSPESYAPSAEMVEALGEQIALAVERGELGSGAATDEGLRLLSILHAGMLSQQMANQPAATFDDGAYTRELPRLVRMFAATFPVAKGRRATRG